MSTLCDQNLSAAAAVEQLEAAFADYSNGLDAALMRACRKLVANKVRNEDLVVDGLSIDIVIDGDKEQVCTQRCT
jgi:hypothetical protein